MLRYTPSYVSYFTALINIICRQLNLNVLSVEVMTYNYSVNAYTKKYLGYAFRVNGFNRN